MCAGQAVTFLGSFKMANKLGREEVLCQKYRSKHISGKLVFLKTLYLFILSYVFLLYISFFQRHSFHLCICFFK